MGGHFLFQNGSPVADQKKKKKAVLWVAIYQHEIVSRMVLKYILTTFVCFFFKSTNSSMMFISIQDLCSLTIQKPPGFEDKKPPGFEDKRQFDISVPVQLSVGLILLSGSET